MVIDYPGNRSNKPSMFVIFPPFPHYTSRFWSYVFNKMGKILNWDWIGFFPRIWRVLSVELGQRSVGYGNAMEKLHLPITAHTVVGTYALWHWFEASCFWSSMLGMGQWAGYTSGLPSVFGFGFWSKASLYLKLEGY